MKKIISLFGLIASLLFIFGCKSPVSENEVETGSLLGTVILDGTETNNNGFIISIAGTSLIATTNSKGNFKISNVPVGKDYEVAIIYGTYTCTWKTDVEIKNHKKTDLGTFEITTDVIKKGNKALNGQDGKDGKDGKDGLLSNGKAILTPQTNSQIQNIFGLIIILQMVVLIFMTGKTGLYCLQKGKAELVVLHI